MMVSRKTRRVSKVNKRRQLLEVGFDKFLVNKWLINRDMSFCTSRRSPQIPHARGVTLEKCAVIVIVPVPLNLIRFVSIDPLNVLVCGFIAE